MLEALPALGATIGGGLGPIASQLMGGGLGGPLMRALEMSGLVGKGPTGHDVVSGIGNAIGLPTDNLLAELLGNGLEMATDPTMFIGGLAGKALGGLGKETALASAASKAAQEASLAARLESMAGGGLTDTVRREGQRVGATLGEQAAQKQLLGSAQLPIQPFLDEVAPMRNFINPVGGADPKLTRTFLNPEPSLAYALEEMGIGHGNPAAPNGVVTLDGMNLKRKVNPIGKFTGPTQAAPPPFAKTVTGNRPYNLVENQNVPIPKNYPTGEEMDLLRQVTRAHDPEAIASIHPLGSQPFTGSGASMLGPEGELLTAFGGGNVPGATVDPMRAIANSRYLDEASIMGKLARSQADLTRVRALTEPLEAMNAYTGTRNFQGPFSTPIAGETESSLRDYLLPLLGAGGVGAGLGAAWGMGGSQPQYRR